VISQNKVDFVDLKEKLTKFDEDKESFAFGLKFRQYNRTPSYLETIEWKHDKSAVTISVLIEILKSQIDAFSKLIKTVPVAYQDPDYLIEAKSSLSETNTRLQNLIIKGQ